MKALGAVGEGLAELSLGREAAEVSLGFGGDLANVCVMAARLGVPARLAGRVGKDGLGGRLRRFWSEAGVDVSAVRSDPEAPTGLYVNEDAGSGGHRFTYWRRGSAGSRLQPADLSERFFAGLGILVVSGVTIAVSDSAPATVREAIKRGRAAGAKAACVLNYRPTLGAEAEDLAALARDADIVIGSREDARTVFGEDQPSRLLALLGSTHAELVLSDGPQPAVAASADGAVRQPVPEVEVRNAAGAGDALAGAYLAARLLGDQPDASLALGVAAASLSVRRAGCAASYPSAAEATALADILPPADRAAVPVPAAGA